MPGVEVLRADRAGRRWAWYHQTYTVCAVVDDHGGGAEWVYRGKTYRIGTGGLQLMQPGEIHRNSRVLLPGTFRVLFLEPAVVERAAEELGLSPARPNLRVAQLDGAPLFRHFEALHGCLERHASVLERQTRLATCLRLLLEQCAETPGRPLRARSDGPAVARARAFLEEHVADHVGLDELALAAGCVSRFHLVRAFTAEVGLPPHAYQLQLRIARARDLLAMGMPGADVAAELGFADQSHFTRHFRRVLGVTPGAYRPDAGRQLVLPGQVRPRA